MRGGGIKSMGRLEGRRMVPDARTCSVYCMNGIGRVCSARGDCIVPLEQ